MIPRALFPRFAAAALAALVAACGDGRGHAPPLGSGGGTSTTSSSGGPTPICQTGVGQVCTTVANCEGKRTCADDGLSWGPCVCPTGTPCTPDSTAPCYAGAPATEGVGTCHAGIKTCVSDGSDYGFCEGQVVPQPFDDCRTPEDEDCDGDASPCKPGELLWARGGNSDEQDTIGLEVGDLDADAQGNLLVTGMHAPFNEYLYATARFTPDGQHLWTAKNLPSLSNSALGLEGFVDAAGAAYGIGTVTKFPGERSTQIEFGFGLPPMETRHRFDYFVIKFDDAGAPQWAQMIGNPYVQLGAPDEKLAVQGYRVAGNAAGETILVGNFTDKLVFDDEVFVENYTGTPKVFLAKLDAAGTAAWVKTFDMAGGAAAPTSVAVDPAGGVVLLGSSPVATPFEGTTLGPGFYLARFDASGQLLWSQTIPNPQPGLVVCRDAAFDSNGDIVVTGVFKGPLDLGGGVISSPTYSFFLAKFDGMGNPLWSKGLLTGDAGRVRLALDAGGAIGLTGSFIGQIDFGGGALVPPKGGSFVAMLEPSGAHRWSRLIDKDPMNQPAVVPTAITFSKGQLVLGGLGGPGKTYLDGRVLGGDNVVQGSMLKYSVLAAYQP